MSNKKLVIHETDPEGCGYFAYSEKALILDFIILKMKKPAIY